MDLSIPNFNNSFILHNGNVINGILRLGANLVTTSTQVWGSRHFKRVSYNFSSEMFFSPDSRDLIRLDAVSVRIRAAYGSYSFDKVLPGTIGPSRVSIFYTASVATDVTYGTPLTQEEKDKYIALQNLYIAEVNPTFSEKTFSYTIPNFSGGVVSKEPDKSSYYFGETIKLTASPNTNYNTSWTSKTVTIPSENTTLSSPFSLQQVSLSVSVKNSQGGTVSPSPDESHTYDYGKEIDFHAIPDAGWRVKRWGGDVPSYDGLNDISVTLDGNKEVWVEFERDPYKLTLNVSGGTGNWVGNITQSISYQPADSAASIEFKPDDGYRVSSWSGIIEGDIADDGNNRVLINMDSNRSITVVLEEIPKLNLTTSVNGSGVISLPTSTPYEGQTVTLRAIPSKGHRFLYWNINENDSDFLIKGSALDVYMSEDKTVEASFEKLPDYENILSDLFYCPSNEFKSNVISFTYENNTGSAQTLHFRAGFYTDVSKSRLQYFAFSYLDISRWYVKQNDIISKFNVNGLLINDGESVEIIYDPDILPSVEIESQKDFLVNNTLEEYPLLCGVQYYVDVDTYDTDTEAISSFKTYPFIFNCEDVDANYWRCNKDKDNWLCSGQGRTDILVSKSGENLLNSDIDSNLFGLHLIAWQSQKGSVNYINGSTWDSSNDKIYSSGQGLYDKRYLYPSDNTSPISVFNPHVLTDISQNFYISAHGNSTIYSNKCNLPVSDSSEELSQIEVFDDFCYPGYQKEISLNNNVLIRVRDEDVSDSLIINKEKVLPVINKQEIYFDISGIQGAYAVRIRRDEDVRWNDWININADLYEKENTKEAFMIDNDRFLVPFSIRRVNGVRRFCFEVLTSYGRTKTTCLECFVNLDLLEYAVEFYIDENYSKEVPLCNGYPVLSQLRDEEDKIVDNITSIYIKVLFNNKQIYGLNENENLKFNFIQQGRNDQYNLPLSTEDGLVYKGSFSISKDDGIFNKDGKGFINIILPEDNENYVDTSDSSDIFNVIIDYNNLEQYKDSNPEEVFNEFKAKRVNKVLDIDSLKQYYNKDDADFRFGNPDIFK